VTASPPPPSPTSTSSTSSTPADAPRDRYHHGDLRRALLAAAVEAIDDVGPTAMSLRDVARRAGVSHAAPAHHFGDKAGLLSALAAEGFRGLADELDRAARDTDSFLEVGVAYVRFAVGHPAHFAVMFRPDLLHTDDPELLAARAASSAALYGGVGQIDGGDPEPQRGTAAVAAWALVHGVATLWLAGALPDRLGDDPEAIARAVARHLGPT
jgi:AcrR family transcriptional regulator